MALPASVTTVIIGGERVLPQIVQRWARLVGRSVRLLNTYGPTETTVAVTVSDLTGIGASEDVNRRSADRTSHSSGIRLCAG